MSVPSKVIHTVSTKFQFTDFLVCLYYNTFMPFPFARISAYFFTCVPSRPCSISLKLVHIKSRSVPSKVIHTVSTKFQFTVFLVCLYCNTFMPFPFARISFCLFLYVCTQKTMACSISLNLVHIVVRYSCCASWYSGRTTKYTSTVSQETWRTTDWLSGAIPKPSLAWPWSQWSHLQMDLCCMVLESDAPYFSAPGSINKKDGNPYEIHHQANIIGQARNIPGRSILHITHKVARAFYMQ